MKDIKQIYKNRSFDAGNLVECINKMQTKLFGKVALLTKLNKISYIEYILEGIAWENGHCPQYFHNLEWTIHILSVYYLIWIVMYIRYLLSGNIECHFNDKINPYSPIFLSSSHVYSFQGKKKQ